ncbi:MAG: hypothetical protein KF756_06015 [Acidobacteria bacterium]|nr:hypothetical protein [Acidobacteriota bacterium]
MKFGLRLVIQSAIFALIGATPAYFLRSHVPSDTISELFKLLGGIVAVSGSLLGWTAGWLDQTRTRVKEIDYNSAIHLFQEVGFSQKRLIWRWGLALFCSVVVVVGSVALKSKSLDARIVETTFVVCSALIMVALFSVFSLFQSMLASAELKAKLEEFEHSELRKLRNTPEKDGDKKDKS